LAEQYSARSRCNRSATLRRLLRPCSTWKVLDLGSGDGSHIHAVLPAVRDVVLADLDAAALAAGAARFGYQTVLLPEEGALPFADGEFDLTFCSSAIEHVTGPKGRVGLISSSQAFRNTALAHQKVLADEIRRISRSYFVQTPHRYFVMDSHAWVPVPLALMPRPWLLWLVPRLNRHWIKQTRADWHLLSAADMRQLFPDARILVERSFGLPKSLIAVRLETPDALSAEGECAPVEAVR
ncbi:MAG: methyltransferase domain-containing protein, partial [Armatimonadota bacterium]